MTRPAVVPRRIVAARRRARGRRAASGRARIGGRRSRSVAWLRWSGFCARASIWRHDACVRLVVVLFAVLLDTRVGFGHRAGASREDLVDGRLDAALPAVRGVCGPRAARCRPLDRRDRRGRGGRRALGPRCLRADDDRLQPRRSGRSGAPVRHLRRRKSETRAGARRSVAVRVRRSARSLRLARARVCVRVSARADPACWLARGLAHVRARLHRHGLARNAQRRANIRARDRSIALCWSRASRRWRCTTRAVSARGSSAVCSRSAVPTAQSTKHRRAGSASGTPRSRCGARIRSRASVFADSVTRIRLMPRRRIVSSTPTSDTGASHAHQIVLEVLSETGVVGLVFWFAGAVFAVRAWWRADAAARAHSRRHLDSRSSRCAFRSTRILRSIRRGGGFCSGGCSRSIARRFGATTRADA